MWCRCTFSNGSKMRRPRRRRRARRSPRSRARDRRTLRAPLRCRPSASHAVSGSTSAGDARPVPCRRSRAPRSSAPRDGRSARTPSARSSSVRTAANGVDRQAAAARETSSRGSGAARSRARARSAGRSRRSAAAAAAAAGTFSNSNVTTSTPRANARIALEVVVRRLTISTSAIWPVGRVVLGRERVDAVAEAPRRHGEHASQLPAAEHADRRAREDRCERSRERVAPDRRRQSRRDRPAASRAAPGATSRGSPPRAGRRWPRPPRRWRPSPPARPFGICTIDSSESSPLSAALCTGTPITGKHRVRGDHARQVRGAAGAGDDHLEAALGRRARRTRPSSAGVRCAETIRHSCGTPNSRQHLVGLPHRLPVGLAAHDDADERTRLRHARISS